VVTARFHVVAFGDSARMICAALGRPYTLTDWRELLRWNELEPRTLEERLRWVCQADMPIPGTRLESPASWRCLAKDAGDGGAPRCFWRLYSPGPVGFGEPASGPLCEACAQSVERVLARRAVA
jgi:hypothetical protein